MSGKVSRRGRKAKVADQEEEKEVTSTKRTDPEEEEEVISKKSSSSSLRSKRQKITDDNDENEEEAVDKEREQETTTSSVTSSTLSQSATSELKDSSVPLSTTNTVSSTASAIIMTSSRRVSSRQSYSSRDLLLPTPSSSRITRSRSRTPGLGPSVAPPTITSSSLRQRLIPVPRLDIQSEDEEDQEMSRTETSRLDNLSTQEVDVLPDISTSKIPRVSLALASLVMLLVLLMLTRGLVTSLQGNSGGQERGSGMFSYLLYPIRQAASYPASQTPPSIDYDQLASRLISSEKFRQVLEKVAGEQVEKMGASLRQQVNSITVDIVSENRTKELELALTGTRAELIDQMGKVTQSMEGNQDNKFKIRLADKERDIDLLKEQINKVHNKIDTLTMLSKEIGSKDQQNVTDQMNLLRQKVKSIEIDLNSNMEEVSKCCKQKEELGGVVESIVGNTLEQFIKEKKHNSQIELESKLGDIEIQLSGKIETLQGKLSDQRIEAEKVVQLGIEDLRQKLGNELKAGLQQESDRLQTLLEMRIHQATERQNVVTDYGDIVSSPEEVTRIVREALTKYDADKTGLFDFALETAGGSIVTTKCTESYQMTSAVMSVWGVPFWWDSNSPRSILQPTSAPGQCWAFRGSQGNVVVKLSSPIYITAVSIEHISSLLSPDGSLRSAPSSMTLFGVVDENHIVPLQNFTYKAAPGEDPVQTFWLGDAGPHSTEKFDTVELAILNNHGHSEYTCLYRFRVHGTIKSQEEKLH